MSQLAPRTPLAVSPSSQGSLYYLASYGHFSLVSEHMYEIHFLPTELLNQYSVAYVSGFWLSWVLL